MLAVLLTPFQGCNAEVWVSCSKAAKTSPLIPGSQVRLLRMSGRRALPWRPLKTTFATMEEVEVVLGMTQFKVTRPVFVLLTFPAVVTPSAWHCAPVNALSSACNIKSALNLPSSS